MQLDGLTTPKKIDQKVAAFCRQLSNQAPVYLKVEPELWCRQSTCDMNVERLIEQVGGSKLNGYKIWYLKGKYIEAMRHVVHELDSVIRDLTFNTDGEAVILFVPDSPQAPYESRPIKVREGFTQRARMFCQFANMQDRQAVRLSNEQSWKKMLTYERWLAGERMPNMWAEVVS